MPCLLGDGPDIRLLTASVTVHRMTVAVLMGQVIVAAIPAVTPIVEAVAVAAGAAMEVAVHPVVMAVQWLQRVSILGQTLGQTLSRITRSGLELTEHLPTIRTPVDQMGE